MVAVVCQQPHLHNQQYRAWFPEVLIVLLFLWWCSWLQLNTQLGTALINAYRRTPEVSSRSDPHSLALALERADGVAAQLASRRQANQQTYALLAAMHAEVGAEFGVVCVPLLGGRYTWYGTCTITRV
jgi:hypothetical protein